MYSNSCREISEQQVSISDYWQTAYALSLPVVLWHSPKQNCKHLILSFNRTIQTSKIDFEELPMGFALSPFLNPEGDKTLFIEADLHCKFDKNTVVEKHRYSEVQPERIEWEKALESSSVCVPTDRNTSSLSCEDTGQGNPVQNHYQKIVADGIIAIEKGEFQKVVLSRKKEIELSDGFSPIEQFEKLCKLYSNTFVSLIYLPQLNQIWLGATPETLVSIDKYGIFKTMALAGTQPAFDENGLEKSVKQAQWTQKEIEEQAYVSRYIIDCLKKIRVREFIEEGPKTVIAGNLMHLRTDFTIDSEAINFSQLGSVMLDLLHPTSAVCGMPKAEALQFILENEGYDRSFYAGYLGPVNVENESALYVNLRCMKIENQIATLYAGAGITEDSDPTREWQETELKCQTLSKIL